MSVSRFARVMSVAPPSATNSAAIAMTAADQVRPVIAADPAGGRGPSLRSWPSSYLRSSSRAHHAAVIGRPEPGWRALARVVAGHERPPGLESRLGEDVVDRVVEHRVRVEEAVVAAALTAPLSFIPKPSAPERQVVARLLGLVVARDPRVEVADQDHLLAGVERPGRSAPWPAPRGSSDPRRPRGAC